MSSTDPSATTPVATTIGQHKFSRYAQAWVKAAGSGKGLPEAFHKDGCERLQYASFDFQSIVWLVSTVGARQIKAQFVLVSEDHDDNCKHPSAYFSIVLYAVDAMGGRISAYYLGDNSFTPTPPKAAAPAKEQALAEGSEYASADTLQQAKPLGGPVAFDLVKTWLTNWTGQPSIHRHLFTSNYGPLQGYSFNLNDFLDPLFYSQKFGDTQVLHVGFALHEYHAAFPKHDDETLTRTFGLVLRVYGTVDSDENTEIIKLVEGRDQEKQLRWAYVTDTLGDGPGQPFYDLSHPYPPGANDSE